MFRLSALVLMLALVLAVCHTGTTYAADSGKIVYGVGNCFVIETSKGFTLFERSGGQLPKVNQVTRGTLDDFGYQQLYDGAGRELMLGFVQDFGVTDEQTVSAFKKSCR